MVDKPQPVQIVVGRHIEIDKINIGPYIKVSELILYSCLIMRSLFVIAISDLLRRLFFSGYVFSVLAGKRQFNTCLALYMT